MRARFKGVTMLRLFYSISLLFLLSACSNKNYPDLSHYHLEGFIDEPAVCDRNSQCKYIGYGNANGGCPSNPVFRGFVIYSSKIGPANINHLKQLAFESSPWLHKKTLKKSSFYQSAEYELEECLPIGNRKLKLMCMNNKCVDTLRYEN